MPSMDAVRARLDWALEDGLVILGIALAWLVLTVVVNLLVALFRALFFETGLVGVFPEFVERVLIDLLRGTLATELFLQLALANVALYVLARAGMYIVEAYRVD
jgi:hypothetical protein